MDCEGLVPSSPAKWKELIDTFHHTVPTRRHWKHMKAYDNCFSGIEAITYFHKALQDKSECVRSCVNPMAQSIMQQNKVITSIHDSLSPKEIVFPKNNSKSPNVLHLANHRYKKSNKDKLTKEYVRKKRVGKENIDPLLMREATEYHDTKQSRYIQGHNNSELIMEKPQAWREPKPIPEMTKHLSEMPQETYEHKPIYTTEPVCNQELTSESSHMRQEKKIALGTSQASCEQKLIGKQGSFVHPYGIFPMMAGNNIDDLSDDEFAGFVVKSCWCAPNLRISTCLIFLGEAQLEVEGSTQRLDSRADSRPTCPHPPSVISRWVGDGIGMHGGPSSLLGRFPLRLARRSSPVGQRTEE
uniref:Uncharacterized protein n=1 Tax=Timema poppense TaxID=170557 RepID=A0A7R9H140_TIMPO|nr:unnamed protein product [Timema poppensis]